MDLCNKPCSFVRPAGRLSTVKTFTMGITDKRIFSPVFFFFFFLYLACLWHH